MGSWEEYGVEIIPYSPELAEDPGAEVLQATTHRFFRFGVVESSGESALRDRTQEFAQGLYEALGRGFALGIYFRIQGECSGDPELCREASWDVSVTKDGNISLKA